MDDGGAREEDHAEEKEGGGMEAGDQVETAGQETPGRPHGRRRARRRSRFSRSRRARDLEGAQHGPHPVERQPSQETQAQAL